MNNSKTNYDFIIKIDFEKGSRDPSRVFTTMSNLIETFQAIDADLAKTIDVSISPVLILEDVETGSLKSYLRNILESIDDNAIKDFDWKKIVGSYLYKAKYKILFFLKDKKQITDRSQIDLLQNDLLLLAEETNVRGLPGYAPIPTNRLLNGIRNISYATKNLTIEDKVEYTIQDGTVSFNKDFKYDSDFIEGLLTKEIISKKTEMVLKVKKPDYLGESMWDFKHGEHAIQAKIIDLDWLKKFQARTFDLRPGDSIRANVEVQVSYGFKSEVIAIHHLIFEVKEIMPDNSVESNDSLFN